MSYVPAWASLPVEENMLEFMSNWDKARKFVKKEEGVNLSDFDLPTEFEDFLKQTKSEELELSKDKRFKNLFKEIKNNKDISLLKNILNCLCKNQYKSNMNELKNEIAK